MTLREMRAVIFSDFQANSTNIFPVNMMPSYCALLSMHKLSCFGIMAQQQKQRIIFIEEVFTI